MESDLFFPIMNTSLKLLHLLDIVLFDKQLFINFDKLYQV